MDLNYITCLIINTTAQSDKYLFQLCMHVNIVNTIQWHLSQNTLFSKNLRVSQRLDVLSKTSEIFILILIEVLFNKGHNKNKGFILNRIVLVFSLCIHWGGPTNLHVVYTW